MRKVFIDCGFNRGRATTSFPNREEYEEGFEFFAFEPMADYIFNKKDFSKSYPHVSLQKKAVWIEDGRTTFYKNVRRRYEASGLFKNRLGNNEPVEVETIDFSKWLLENFDKNDKIIAKIDIEGAEFEVIPKMIEDGSIYMIDVIYIEIHGKGKLGVRKSNKKLMSVLNSVENGPVIKSQIELKKYRVYPKKP